MAPVDDRLEAENEENKVVSQKFPSGLGAIGLLCVIENVLACTGLAFFPCLAVFLLRGGQPSRLLDSFADTHSPKVMLQPKRHLVSRDKWAQVQYSKL